MDLNLFLYNFGIVGFSILGQWYISSFMGIVAGLMATIAIIYNHYSWQRATIYIARTFLGLISIQIVLFLLFRERLYLAADLFKVSVAIVLLMSSMMIGYLIAAIIVELKHAREYLKNPKAIAMIRKIADILDQDLQYFPRWMQKLLLYLQTKGISLPSILRKWANKLEYLSTSKKPLDQKVHETLSVVKEVIMENKDMLGLILV
jgi:hypothetical protein